MASWIASRRGVLSAIGVVAAAGALVVAVGATSGAGGVAAAGPPFPSPVAGQRVYDTAGIFQTGTIRRAEAIIAGIEARTGAQVAVYTQRVDYGVTTGDAESQARALMDQWGVGRKGFDDGLVILYDIDPSGCHGQVQLYAGAGFRSTILSDAERQRIFEQDMLPDLRDCILDNSLIVALDRVDAAATPTHAAELDRARTIDAIVGLVGAPILFLLLVVWVVAAWLRHGRDPVYLDDPSIHMPAPPPGLTPAAGTLVFDGQSSRRTLTTALIDLAGRGSLAFHQQDEGLLIKSHKVSIEVDPPAPTDEEGRHSMAVARRQELGPAEEYAHRRLRELAASEGTNPIPPDKIPEFAKDVGEFDARLEASAVERGWFTEPPRRAARRWYIRGGLEIVAGVGAFILGFNIPFVGLELVGVAVAAAGIVTAVLGYSMPARTLPGAMIRAMLAAYRRTLEKTMAQARSMGQVVAEAALPWLETPDRAVVWAVALGLGADVQRVLERSVEDVQAGRAQPTGIYLPAWYVAGSGGGGGGGGFGGGGSAFSSSAIPNFAGMMAVLGTIGNAPSSNGGGGFGGGGGGGGGGAGGGF